MKKLLALLAWVAIPNGIIASNAIPPEKGDTLTTPIDSLANYTWHVKNMTILLNEEPVDYSIIFDSETGFKRIEYQQVHGRTNHYEAIKHYGEKYRNGILAYKKESEDDNE